MKNWSFSTFILITSIGLLFSAYAEDGLQEFQIKRKEVYEFAKEPTVKKDGDKITIEFTSKDFCDVTVAIQNQDGDIVNHLACGVLGSNAPEPFQSNSLSQKI